MSANKTTNRLIAEKSPYLLQHAYNPVNWYPWSQEAFDKARQEDKPIFLSIGYSTCHWCHVMERESFEDEETAAILNRHFIAIKVDREERPDIDNIYMTVCQTLTGHGGWPLTVFLTPDKKPFYAGTYFPKNDRMGLPGLPTVLDNIAEAWKNNKSKLIQSGKNMVNILNKTAEQPGEIFGETIHEAYKSLKNNFDSVHGGFGHAPKFPSPHNLYFLLRYWYACNENHALYMVEKTLGSMYRGGIFDHIGYGFSRYSTDYMWLVPHFEKMLYDNALLALAYVETYQITRKKLYSDAAHQIFEYILRDMTSPEGGFYSAEDADSEGVEGKFYLWTPNEVNKVLGNSDGTRFCAHFDITDKGNFEGKNIPNLINNSEWKKERDFIDNCRKRLFNYREQRVHPYKDDKILTAWNGLMIAALAVGGRILESKKYTEAAEKSAQFILSNLVRGDGRVMARFRNGESAYPAYVDDYAFLTWGLIELYETTYKPEILENALRLNNDMTELFRDNDKGGLFIYGNDSEQLIARPKEVYDGATPSGNSVASSNFIKLARLTGRSELEDLAEKQFKAFGARIEQYPAGHTFMLTALLFSLSKSKETVITSDTDAHDTDPMLKAVNEEFRPFNLTVYFSNNYAGLNKIMPFISDYKTIQGKTTAYVCENFTCRSPVTDVDRFREMLH